MCSVYCVVCSVCNGRTAKSYRLCFLIAVVKIMVIRRRQYAQIIPIMCNIKLWNSLCGNAVAVVAAVAVQSGPQCPAFCHPCVRRMVDDSACFEVVGMNSQQYTFI